MILGLTIISFVIVLGILLPISDNKHWIIRGQAYFRFWYLLVSLILIVIWLTQLPLGLYSLVAIFTLVSCSILCLSDVLPFTRLYRKEIRTCTDLEGGKQLDILIFNVYQKNKEYNKLIDKANAISPDLILLLETNEAWQDALTPLKSKYPYSVKSIQMNTYGILLLSKYKPDDKEVKYLTDEEIPSVDFLINMESTPIRIIGLHPKPPIPSEAYSSKQKDAEFKAAAQRIKKLSNDEKVIVVGDLNDVVWSKASHRFKKESGLKDPRVGRGTYSTFPTYAFIRFPLDHIFCSADIELIDFKVLEDIGSDHFPVYAKFKIPIHS